MTTFEAKDPGYADRIRESFARQQVMHLLGVELIEIAPGRVMLSMPFSERLTQQHGFVHAGIVTTALDSACGYAGYSLMPADAGILTIEFKTNLFLPGRGERFTFEGTVIKPGRTITVCEGRAYIGDTTGGRLMASMTATMTTVLGREDVQQ
ncbi:PaaI family thioesterase [Aquisalimonas lutea]|uniref:PaaI family thioesterase n=1 Tax=Aquisalimonas lutea TaxID=1327750 RepID=UPI0025B42727|nr:PaaI family thioesterase [Aquisalimonas lutea]MDN3518128.1 PaaI family thioesterase [Aquisalimonas lutea]